MPTVVIIHSAEDAMPARALAEKLRQAKVTVVLDKPLGEEARAAAKSAQLAVALWSPRSATQPAMIEDVSAVRGKPGVIHACMQNTPTPDQFQGDKSVNLTGWRGEDDFAPWRELASLVTQRLGAPPLPPPAPRPPSGFFQPGRPADAGAAPAPRPAAAQTPRPAQRPAAAAPPPRPAPRPAPVQDEPPARKGGGGLVIGLVALVAIAALGGGGYYFWNQSQQAQSTSAAWDNVERNDAGALRAFIAGDPGDYRDEAETALAELEERTFEAASDADTIEALEGFLNDFPDSEHAIAVRGRIAELQSLPQPPTTDAPPVEGAPPDPDLVPPTATPPSSGPAQLTPPPAPAPAPAPPPSDQPVN